ncbi:MAG: tetratricopeptide repeat protein [Terriglobia bacterium]
MSDFPRLQYERAIAAVAVLLALILPCGPLAAVPQSLRAGLPAAAASPAALLATIPARCRAGGHAPSQARQLLRVAATQPSAEAYNALGAVYGQANELDCAVASFKASLVLDPHSWKTHNNLALAFVEENDLNQATREFRTVIRQQPNAYQAHNGLGLVLEKMGQRDAAAAEFEIAVKMNPRFFFATLNLAEVDLELKRYRAAIYYSDEALALSPPEALADRMRMDQGVAYSENGNYDKARAVFKDLITRHPDSAQLHFNLATSYAHHEQYAEAAKEYRRVLGLDPSNESARISLAQALLIFNQPQQVIPYALKYTLDRPHDALGYEVLGKAYRELGQFQQAAAALSRAVQLDPQNYDARYNLGFSLARLGDTPKAVQELQEAKRLKPDPTQADYELGLLLVKAKNQQAARQEFRAYQALQVKKDNKEKAGVLNNQGNADLKAGKYCAAAQAYEQAVTLDPANAQWHYNYSLALSDLGDHAGEERELQKAVDLNSNLPTAHDDLGLCYLNDHKLSEAEKEFKAALEINPQFSEAQNNLGVLYAREGNNDRAVAMFEQAVTNNPQYAQAFLNWGLILASTRQYAQASALFEKSIQISPGLAAAHTALGEAMVKEGHKEQAIPSFQKVIALQPDSPLAHLNLGIAWADEHKLNEALTQFKEAARLDPHYALAHYNEGRVYAALKQTDEARSELETACKLDPNDPGALDLLATIERAAHHLQRSTELLRKVVALEPDSSGAQYMLGRNLQDMGKTQEAVHHWRLSLRADPNNTKALYGLAQELGKRGSPEAKVYMDRFQELQQRQILTDRVQTLGNFGLQAADEKHWRQAVSDIQQALKLCGNCPQGETLHKDLGLIYSREGDVTDAKRELRAALKLNPDDGDALKAMQIVQTLQAKPAGAN